MDMRLHAVRGAIQVDCDDRETIRTAVHTLFTTVCEKNNIFTDAIVCVLFTMTSDLQSENPATALRNSYDNFSVPLFCMQEPQVIGMLARTIRIMVQFYAPAGIPIQHVYLAGAMVLRPDLV